MYPLISFISQPLSVIPILCLFLFRQTGGSVAGRLAVGTTAYLDEYSIGLGLPSPSGTRYDFIGSEILWGKGTATFSEGELLYSEDTSSFSAVSSLVTPQQRDVSLWFAEASAQLISASSMLSSLADTATVT